MSIATRATIGRFDHGQPMPLAEFVDAETQPGIVIELGRGRISVSEIPKPDHGGIVDYLILILSAYRLESPEIIARVAAASDHRLDIDAYDSSRHPDLSVYLTDPPDVDQPWSTWVPAVVIEVVSPGSETRDYDEKPPEYLAFGVAEYWIVDRPANKITTHTRRGGRWATNVLVAGDKLTSLVLPGLSVDVGEVLKR